MNCSVCAIDKALSEYYPRYKKCKDCVRKDERKRRFMLKEKIKSGVIVRKGKLTCDKCKVEKPIKEFRPARAKCLDCERAHGRTYRKSSIGKYKSNKWVMNNREKMDKLQANWYQANKKKIRAKHRKRYKTDPAYRIRYDACRSGRDALYGRYEKSIIPYVNCKGPLFRDWIRFCLCDGMTILNYSESYWQLDHVIPIGSVDITKKKFQRIILEWYNISPLIKKVNMIKKAKIYKTQLIKHLGNLLAFAEYKKIKVSEKYIKYATSILKDDVINNIQLSDDINLDIKKQLKNMANIID